MMTIEPIAAIGSTSLISGNVQLQEGISSSGSSNAFFDLLGQKLQDVDQSVKQSDTLVQSYIRGDDIPVHEIMISMSKAKTELQLMLEIRNKVLESYQEITRIQL